jgi:hypothetical protein
MLACNTTIALFTWLTGITFTRPQSRQTVAVSVVNAAAMLYVKIKLGNKIKIAGLLTYWFWCGAVIFQCHVVNSNNEMPTQQILFEHLQAEYQRGYFSPSHTPVSFCLAETSTSVLNHAKFTILPLLEDRSCAY